MLDKDHVRVQVTIACYKKEARIVIRKLKRDPSKRDLYFKVNNTSNVL